MTFETAMRYVEDRPFPEHAHFHARRLAWLLARSGLAERGARLPWALVAGSYGKASTARFLASIVRLCLDDAGEGRPVVLATKPPLRETLDGHRERYQVLEAGAVTPRWITPPELEEQVAALEPHVAALEREAPELGPVAPYDLRYAVLWRWALEVGAAFAVIEANIGLRDDPTSALPPPRIQLLTPIDTDHASLLAPPVPIPYFLASLGERAGPVWHKAGGLRRGVPLVVGLQTPDVERAIRELASERGVTDIAWRPRDQGVITHASSFSGSTATVRVRERTFDIALRVLGDFQVDNALHAVAASRSLVEHGALRSTREGWERAAKAGVASTRVPGRMDVVGERPTTVLQVGESTAKMRGFVEAIAPLPAKRIVACATFLARVQDAWSLPEVLARAPLAMLVVTQTAHGGDAGDLDPHEVAARLRASVPGLRVVAEPDPLRALATARAEAGADGVLLVVGSGLVAHVVSR